MKSVFILSAVLITLFSCHDKAPDYPKQLKSIFLNRIGRIDSTVKVDSFRMIRMQPITARLGWQVEDSIYKITYYKVVNQLNASKGLGNTDSIAFYQGELNLMDVQLDSFSRNIANADTNDIHYGQFAVCSYQISRDDKMHSDTTYYFFDKQMNLMNAQAIDSLIRRSLDFIR